MDGRVVSYLPAVLFGDQSQFMRVGVQATANGFRAVFARVCGGCDLRQEVVAEVALDEDDDAEHVQDFLRAFGWRALVLAFTRSRASLAR